MQGDSTPQIEGGAAGAMLPQTTFTDGGNIVEVVNRIGRCWHYESSPHTP